MPRFDEFLKLSAAYLARRLCDREQQKNHLNRVNFWNFCSYPVPTNSNVTAPEKIDCFKLPFILCFSCISFEHYWERISPWAWNVAKTTGQPPYCCYRNWELIKRTVQKKYRWLTKAAIICSKARIWTQIAFRRSKIYFKTTLKKAQRVIKHDPWLKYNSQQHLETFIKPDLALSLYFGENLTRHNNGYSNEGWPDCRKRWGAIKFSQI